MLVSSRYDIFTNGVRMISDEQIQWWSTKFHPVSQMPGAICDRLVDGLPGVRDRHVSCLDPYNDRTDLIITGTDSDGKAFEAGRSFHFRTRSLNLDMASIRPDLQQNKYGRILARNSYRLASALGFDRITLTALQIGAFAWARAGFMPSFESWNGDNCRKKILSKLETLRGHLSSETYSDAKEYLNWQEPQAIWTIADLDEAVTLETNGRTAPLGFVLICGSGASWAGSIELRPCTVRSKQIRRVRGYLELAQTE